MVSGLQITGGLGDEILVPLFLHGNTDFIK